METPRLIRSASNINIISRSELAVQIGITVENGKWKVDPEPLSKRGRLGVGNDPVYNSCLCFEPFSFPPGFDLTEKEPSKNRPFPAIDTAAADLDNWRKKQLNPEGWLNWVRTSEEQAAGFPSDLSLNCTHSGLEKADRLGGVRNRDGTTRWRGGCAVNVQSVFVTDLPGT